MVICDSHLFDDDWSDNLLAWIQCVVTGSELYLMGTLQYPHHPVQALGLLDTSWPNTDMAEKKC